MPLPELSYDALKPTSDYLSLAVQVMGQLKITLMPKMSHREHLPLRIDGRGLSTGLLPGGTEVTLDLIQGVVRVTGTNGRVGSFALEETSVSDFTTNVEEALDHVGVALENSLPDSSVAVSGRYDPVQARRIFRAWAGVYEVLLRFRSRFRGKASEISLDWTTMNFGLSLYSGGDAEGSDESGLPVEVFSCGVSLGDELLSEPNFYGWIHPSVDSISQELRPAGASWNNERSRADLVYRALAPRTDWDTALGWFFDSAYSAQAEAAGWNADDLSFSAEDQ